MKRNPVEVLLSRLEALASDLMNLQAAGPAISSEIAKIEQDLSNMAPASFSGSDALPPEHAQSASRLAALRQKLSLLPGVIRNCEGKFAAVERELTAAVETEETRLRKLAMELREKERQHVSSEMLPKLGDSQRNRKAVEEVVRGSEPSVALNDLYLTGSNNLAANPAAAARHLILIRKRLEAYQTEANRKPATT
ncbi:MAG TPA: hypothetical protein GYA07_05045 [Verrucomicrobia bacterium]|nr:hypothetical protein [Verrucomicrobiota bacterium]HOQ47881.1 hypothetical protein [Bryobacteraceae bacterium]